LSPFIRFWNNLTALQAAAVISALILTIGAIVEYWDKLKLLAFLLLKWILRKSTPLDRCVFKRLLRHSIGPILVVLGIAGEVVFEGRTFVVEDRQEEEAGTIVGSLKKEAEQADEKAKKAIADSSTALSQANDALNKAGKADTAAGTALRTSKAANAAAFEAQDNVEEITKQSDALGRKLWQFESWKSARTLIDPGSFVATLRKFKGKEIVLTSFVEGEDPETFELCNAFFLAASNAEMQAINRCGKEPPSTPPRTGVLVYGLDEKETKEFVEIIANSVTNGGAGGMPPIVGSPLTILVGNQTPFSMDSKELFNPPTIRKKKTRQAKKP
jgi:hypothetical protein